MEEEKVSDTLRACSNRVKASIRFDVEELATSTSANASRVGIVGAGDNANTRRYASMAAAGFPISCPNPAAVFGPIPSPPAGL